MSRRLINPFAPIASRDAAVVLARYSAVAFGLWAVVLLGQAALVLGGAGTEPEQYRGSTAGFAICLAVVAGAAAILQWRRPNRIIAVFGLAWSLFEMSSLLVGLLVGMPMAMGGLPAWAGAITAGAMLVCAVLQVGGLRGATSRHLQAVG